MYNNNLKLIGEQRRLNELKRSREWQRPYCSVKVGPMGSGKSQQLTDEVTKLALQNYSCIVFKFHMDDRYSKDAEIISHNNARLTSGSHPNIQIRCIADTALDAWLNRDTSHPDYTVLNDAIFSFDVFAIDEAHFAKGRHILTRLRDYVVDERGKILVIAAIDKFYDLKPVPTVAEIIFYAEKVDFRVAVCRVCRREAAIYTVKVAHYNNHMKIEDSDVREEVGGEETYMAACGHCIFTARNPEETY
jgi:thymidine kinase